MIDDNKCPAGQKINLCGYYKRGCSKYNCPILKTGSFKFNTINFTLSFSTLNISSIQSSYNDKFLDRQKKLENASNNMNKGECENFWDNIGSVFQFAEKIYNVYSSLKTICGENITTAEKVVALSDVLAAIVKPISKNDPIAEKQAAVRTAIDIATDFIKDFVKQSIEYKNSPNKDYIMFGIEAMSEKTKIIIFEIMQA